MLKKIKCNLNPAAQDELTDKLQQGVSRFIHQAKMIHPLQQLQIDLDLSCRKI